MRCFWLADTPLASACPGLTEVLTNSYRWLAKLGDAEDFSNVVIKALREHEHWPEVIEDAQLHCVSNFSEEKMASSYIEVYENAVK